MRFNRLVIPALVLALGSSALLMALPAPPQGLPQEAYAQQHEDHDRGGWDAPPQEFRDVQRKGFHDGIEGARRDVENHRNPDVNNRDEYRNPQVPRDAWEDYRAGFRRGYETAMSHLMNGMQQPPPPPAVQIMGQILGGWDAPPQEYRDMQRRGFHDGIEAARSDMQNHRPPSVERRNEFRHPSVPREVRDEYRDGFRHGYEAAFSHLRDDHDHHGDDRDHQETKPRLINFPQEARGFGSAPLWSEFRVFPPMLGHPRWLADSPRHLAPRTIRKEAEPYPKHGRRRAEEAQQTR